MKNKLSYLSFALLIFTIISYCIINYLFSSLANGHSGVLTGSPLDVQIALYRNLFSLVEGLYFPLLTISFICAVGAIMSVKRNPSLGGKKIAIFTLIMDIVFILAGISTIIYFLIQFGTGL